MLGHRVKAQALQVVLQFFLQLLPLVEVTVSAEVTALPEVQEADLLVLMLTHLLQVMSLLLALPKEIQVVWVILLMWEHMVEVEVEPVLPEEQKMVELAQQLRLLAVL